MEKLSELTKEEAKIINMMTEGYSYKQIADKIGRKPHFVCVTITRIKRQYGCRSSVQLVAKLFREQLLAV